MISRRYHLTLSFWLYGLLTILVGLAAHTTGLNLLYFAFGLMIAGLLMSGLISGATMMSLRAVRLDPGHGMVGEPLVVRYAVTNRNPILPAFTIHIEEMDQPPADHQRRRWWKPRLGLRRKQQPTGPVFGADWTRLMPAAGAWILHVGPRETVHGEAVFWPHHRGEARFRGIRIWTSFPFGIIRKSVIIDQPMHTLIYPRLASLKRQVLRTVSPEGPLGLRVTNCSGSGDDYFGMRDYRPGDSMRHIAWKRAAGLDQLVSIERSRPNPPRLRVVLNLMARHPLPQNPDELAALREDEEQAICLAGSLIHAADAAGYEVAVSAMGVKLPLIRLRRGSWHVAKIMAALAEINLDAPRSSGSQPPPDAERSGQIVIHPQRVDPSIGRSDAAHFTAAQLAVLTTDRPVKLAASQSAARKSHQAGAAA